MTNKKLDEFMNEPGSFRTKLQNLLWYNPNKLNRDNYLSFEEVGSLHVAGSNYNWIDGVQLVMKGNNFGAAIWVSSENSERIFFVSPDEVPVENEKALFDKVFKALGI